jgi:hypothetical protein
MLGSVSCTGSPDGITNRPGRFQYKNSLAGGFLFIFLKKRMLNVSLESSELLQTLVVLCHKELNLMSKQINHNDRQANQKYHIPCCDELDMWISGHDNCPYSAYRVPFLVLFMICFISVSILLPPPHPGFFWGGGGGGGF